LALLYLRGIALERAGRWTEAERDLQGALKLNPTEPELLNFLGYSWIDRNEHLPEALAMVQKAVDARPQSGAMLDSLGWAYYRLGDYKKAVEKLERPSSWSRATRTSTATWATPTGASAARRGPVPVAAGPEPGADDKQKADSEAKLKNGLGGPARPTSSTIARN
jgi:tetratricopeptide (TPR) repeat protein